MHRPLLLASALALFTACDYDGRAFTPQPLEDYPGIKELGELSIVPIDAWEVERAGYITYDILGPSEPAVQGGATATFVGTGGEVCVMVDPEAVFWNQSIAANGPNATYAVADNLFDDGDIDIEVGLSAYYTGSPGLEIGGFEQPYEDSLGNQVTIEFNECLMTGIRGQLGAHAGRATPEYCTIDTSLHPDREYTIVLKTWSVPKDDYTLSYGVVVFEGPCAGNITPSGVANIECTMPNEADDESFAELERAFCAGNQADYCRENPGMCG